MRVTSSAIAGALSTSTLNGFTGSSRAPFLPVDGLYLPNVYREDARISKIVPLGENPARKMYSNFEAFNLFNSTEFTGITTQDYTALGAVLTPTPAAFSVGNGDSANPEGNLARHLQSSLRFTF